MEIIRTLMHNKTRNTLYDLNISMPLLFNLPSQVSKVSVSPLCHIISTCTDSIDASQLDVVYDKGRYHTGKQADQG